MKKLYKKGKIHPSPSPSPPSPSSSTYADHYLSVLPAAILTLAAALSPEDKQVLAYLISCCGTAAISSSTSSGHRKKTRNNGRFPSGGADDHSPMFQCSCFRCYMSFWARWDASPNRQVIHDIIETYEEGLLLEGGKKSTAKRSRKKREKRVSEIKNEQDHHRSSYGDELAKDELGESESVEPSHDYDDDDDDLEAETSQKGSVRNMMSFLGDKLWGIWN